MITEVGQQRQQYLDALEQMGRAGDRTIAALEALSHARAVARGMIESGRPLSELEQVLEPHPLRAGLSDALGDLERTRHHAQRLLFQLLQSEGQTLADIGRSYGISRQLVSRLVNEPEPDPVT